MVFSPAMTDTVHRSGASRPVVTTAEGRVSDVTEDERDDRAVDWLGEVRRLQEEDGLTTAQAIERANQTHGEG